MTWVGSGVTTTGHHSACKFCKCSVYTWAVRLHLCPDCRVPWQPLSTIQHQAYFVLTAVVEVVSFVKEAY